jgi:hypothetical protein
MQEPFDGMIVRTVSGVTAHFFSIPASGGHDPDDLKPAVPLSPTRPQPDGSGDSIYVVRLVPSGSGTYRPSYLATCGSLDAAKAIAAANLPS